MKPGRKATRNFSRSVSRVSAAVTSQASSHQVPVGVRTASKPSCSAERAICARYSMSGGRNGAASERPCPLLRPWPPPVRTRLSPAVGRNQWNFIEYLQYG